MFSVNRCLLHGVFCLALVFPCLPGVTMATTTYTWMSGVDGNWTDPVNWSENHVPNGPDDQAWIDGHSTQVTVILPYTNTTIHSVSGLRVDLGDTLAFQRNQTLELVSDGVLDPILTNNGLIQLGAAGVNGDWLRANAVVVSIEGSGIIQMGPGLGNTLDASGGGSFIHGSDHTIRGSGTLAAPFVNQGNIIASYDEEELIVSADMDNTAGVLAASGSENTLMLKSTITGGLIDPGDGLILLDGAILVETLLGAGHVNLFSQSWFQGDLTLDGTQVGVGFETLELVALEGQSESEITNNGTIFLSGWGVNQSLLRADGTTVTLDGSGLISMTGNAGLAALNGGEFINGAGHTIKGNGYISAPMTNQGDILAQDGQLRLNVPLDNTNGVLGAQGSTGDLYLHTEITGGLIGPGDGLVQLDSATLVDTTMNAGMVYCGNSRFKGSQLLNGTEFSITRSALTIEPDQSGGDPVITNHGIISLLPYGAGGSQLYINGCKVSFSGTGTMVLDRYSGILELDPGSLANDIHHTIRGYGLLGLPVENNGMLQVENGTLRVDRQVTGSGRLVITSAGILDLRADMVTGDMFMAETAGLITPAGPMVLEVKGDFSFAFTEEYRWNALALTPLTFSGGGASPQYLEVGGLDLELNNSGFSSNFQFDQLTIEGSDTVVYLADTVDNGNRSSNEALYVGTFQVLPGATLNLNGINLYTREESVVHQVAAGDGGQYGGGSIVDAAVLLPDIDASPREMAFDAVAVGGQSAPQTITVTNSGTEPVAITSVALAGDGFQLNDTCGGMSLSNADACTIDVTFAPVAEGEAAAGVIIRSDDPGEPYITVVLGGTGYVPEACRADLDGDHAVDASDLDLFVLDFGNPECPDPLICEGDIDGDGDADAADLSIVVSEFGRLDCP